jgi:hypothetical protein
MVLIFSASYFGPDLVFASSRAHAQDNVEKTIPQGEDPPGTEQQTAPPVEHKGVITPPPVGDEGIYTKVPNPDAGHDKEVIRPPGSSGENPKVEPR